MVEPAGGKGSFFSQLDTQFKRWRMPNRGWAAQSGGGVPLFGCYDNMRYDNDGCKTGRELKEAM